MIEENKNSDQDQVQGQEESARMPEEIAENELDQVSGGVHGQPIETLIVDKQLGIKTTVEDGYVYHPIKSNDSKI